MPQLCGRFCRYCRNLQVQMPKGLLRNCRSAAGMILIGNIKQSKFFTIYCCLPSKKLCILRLIFVYLVNYFRILFPKIIQITLKAAHTTPLEISTSDVSYSMKNRNGNFLLRSLLPAYISSICSSTSKSSIKIAYVITLTLAGHIRFLSMVFEYDAVIEIEGELFL